MLAGLPHTEWMEFRFVVMRPGALSGDTQRTLALFTRSERDLPWECKKELTVSGKNLRNYATKLDRGSPLTFIAVTMTVVCDPTREQAAGLQQASRTQPQAAN